MTQKDNTVQAKLVSWDNPQKVTFVWGPRQRYYIQKKKEKIHQSRIYRSGKVMCACLVA